MLPDQVSNPEPLTYESGALPTALRGPAYVRKKRLYEFGVFYCIVVCCIAIFLGVGRGGNTFWHSIIRLQ